MYQDSRRRWLENRVTRLSTRLQPAVANTAPSLFSRPPSSHAYPARVLFFLHPSPLSSNPYTPLFNLDNRNRAARIESGFKETLSIPASANISAKAG